MSCSSCNPDVYDGNIKENAIKLSLISKVLLILDLITSLYALFSYKGSNENLMYIE